MKEIDGIRIEDTVVSEIKIPINKTFRKIANLRPTINGGKIFAYQIETKILGHARVSDSVEKDLTGQGDLKTWMGFATFTDTETHKKMDLMPGCIYLEALNLKNAIKRLKAGKILFTT